VEDDDEAEQEERTARLKANQAALARLDEIALNDQVSATVLQRMRDEYEDRIRQLEAFDAESSESINPLFSSDYECLLRAALKVERRTLIQLRNDRVINDETLRHIQRDIDLAEARLKPGAA
jgi:CPA1 family monovalent cation:H+ antiporter